MESENPWGVLPAPKSWNGLVANIFTIGKALAGAKFPAIPESGPSRDVFVGEWVIALKRINAPWDVWPEAVRWWCGVATEHQRWDVAQAKRARDHVYELWQSDPELRQILENRRNNRLRHRIELGELPSGVLPENASTATQGALPAGHSDDQGGEERFRQFIREATQRARDRKIAEALRPLDDNEEDR